MTNWRDEIAKLIEDENRAWNRGDAEAFSEAVEAGCVFTNIFGQAFVGRDAFQQQHARIFSTIYKGSNLSQKVDQLRLVRPDVAIADTSATLSVPASEFGAERTVRTKLLQVFLRDGDRWQIVSYHNVEERPLPTS